VNEGGAAACAGRGSFFLFLLTAGETREEGKGKQVFSYWALDVLMALLTA